MDFLCFDFINSNSQWRITHDPHDPFQDEQWVNDLLDKWQLKVSPSLTRQQLESLISLRSLLAESLGAICKGEVIPEAQFQEINHYLSLTKLNYQLIKENERYKTVPNPVVRDWNYVLSSITASFAQLISGPEVNRIRQCENPQCKWFFYDESKNYSRRWCGNTCASLMKVRRFREKQKE